jgi:DNA-binding Lrp family transcriptional regulator
MVGQNAGRIVELGEGLAAWVTGESWTGSWSYCCRGGDRGLDPGRRSRTAADVDQPNPASGRPDKVRKFLEMITAYVLIQTEVGQAGQVASAAAEIDGVEQALPLAGPYDVIVRAEARSIDALGRLVVSRIQAINGVTRTLTCSVVHL